MDDRCKPVERTRARATAIACATIVLAALGCSSATAGDAARGAASTLGPLELPASFEGTLPCADCEGVHYHLDLFADHSFFLRSAHLGRSDEGVLDDIGSWSLAGDDGRLTLHGGREAPELFRVVDPGTLRKLDREGRETVVAPGADLRRTEPFSPIEPRLAMRGMYRYMADAALYEECLTGRRFPVAMEADNLALERGYLESKTAPGAPVLVTLEGRIAERPAMEGDARELVVVPERFIGVWPGETCGARMSTAELENTYWKLTRLGDRPVIVGEEQREPHMVLRAEGGQVDAFGGCNRMSGSYVLDGDSIRFGPMATTMMACPEGEDTEHEMQLALDRARSWRIVGEHLELLDDTGEIAARFEARYME